MGAIALELVMKLLVMGLGRYMKKHARDVKGKRDYIAFNEIMFAKGLTSVQLRLTSNGQVERIKEMWKEEENAD